MLIVHVLSLFKLSQKKTPECIPPHLCPLPSPHLNPVDDRMWEILQEKVCKTGITDLKLSTTPLTNGCRNDDMMTKIYCSIAF